MKKTEIPLAYGLKMSAVLYPGAGGGPQKTPVLCIPGLTRNARDFEDVAPKIAGLGRETIVVSLRGRGASDDDPDISRYHPLTYRDDILRVFDHLGIENAVFLGTSLGGIVTMLTSEAEPGRVHAAIINDVGPELAPEGMARISSYVGAGQNGDDKREQQSDERGPRGQESVSFAEAVRAIRAINEVAFPNRDDDFWETFARRTFRETSPGRWALDYDSGIGKAFAVAPAPPDLWPGFESLAQTPTLVIRGALSDLLSPEIVEKMRAARPGFDYCEVPAAGHAPTLSEPAAWNAIERFLAKID